MLSFLSRTRLEELESQELFRMMRLCAHTEAAVAALKYRFNVVLLCFL